MQLLVDFVVILAFLVIMGFIAMALQYVIARNKGTYFDPCEREDPPDAQTLDQLLEKRFIEDTDNGTGPKWLFRVNDDGTTSIAQLADLKQFIREII